MPRISIMFLDLVVGYDVTGLVLPVTGPLTVSAAYQTSVNWKWIYGAIGVLAAVGVIYYLTQREVNRRRRGTRW